MQAAPGTCVPSCSAQLSLALCRDTQGLPTGAAAVPRLGKLLFCCHQWVEGSSPRTPHQLHARWNVEESSREGARRSQGARLPGALLSCVSPACCWHLSSPGDLPGRSFVSLSVTLPSPGQCGGSGSCHSPGSFVGACPLRVPVSAGPSGTERTGTGGQSWIPGIIPSQHCSRECLRSRAARG